MCKKYDVCINNTLKLLKLKYYYDIIYGINEKSGGMKEYTFTNII